MPALTAELEAKRDAAEAKKAAGKKAVAAGTAAATEKPKLVPFYAAIQTVNLDTQKTPDFTALAPEAKERVHVGGTHATANAPVVATPGQPAGGVTQPVTAEPVTGPATGVARKKHARSKKKHAPDDPLSLSNAVSGRW
jgi:hypothetical protein